MNLKEVLTCLEKMSDPSKINLKKEKFGIVANKSLGIYHKDLKVLATEIGQDNKLAINLFESGVYEARILCSKVYDPSLITETQMNHWVQTFENWEICDSFCMGFFAKSEFALRKALEWSRNDKEFVKRAGFVKMASYGFANKEASNDVFEQFFPIIERESIDERTYVKKAVNWALRNIGKRNIDLQQESIECAKRILTIESKSAKWIASNALNELTKAKINILDYPRKLYRND